jgi:hypothetical protein
MTPETAEAALATAFGIGMVALHRPAARLSIMLFESFGMAAA